MKKEVILLSEMKGNVTRDIYARQTGDYLTARIRNAMGENFPSL